MQTGQKLSEICGEAFHAAGLSHGYNFSQTDMGHSEEASIIKQLIEFPCEVAVTKRPDPCVSLAALLLYFSSLKYHAE